MLGIPIYGSIILLIDRFFLPSCVFILFHQVGIGIGIGIIQYNSWYGMALCSVGSFFHFTSLLLLFVCSPISKLAFCFNLKQRQRLLIRPFLLQIANSCSFPIFIVLTHYSLLTEPFILLFQ